MENSKEKGITLIALIITIIVLLILAGVSISMVVGDNGILTQAVNASIATDISETKEAIELAIIGYLDENGNYTTEDVEQAVTDSEATLGEDGVTVTTAKGNNFDISDLVNGASVIELISTTESYVGYYADGDGDGKADGIIYADLLIGGSGTWNTYFSYSYDTISSSKDYYFITSNLIASVSTSTGDSRFYVMALNDFTTSEYSEFYWYYDSINNSDSSSIANTSAAFGSGKSNTSTMITYWKNNTYGSQNSQDIWGVIQDKVDEGWFVPSVYEWLVFAGELKITSNNYNTNYNLSDSYWTSSPQDSNNAIAIHFKWDLALDAHVSEAYPVRLSATF